MFICGLGRSSKYSDNILVTVENSFLFTLSVLPKYEVVITAPDYVVINDKSISASVCAK